jgi:hypothetical protein
MQTKFFFNVQFGDEYKPSSSLLCNFLISTNQVHLHCAIWWWVQTKFIFTVQFGDKCKPSSSSLWNLVMSTRQVHLYCAIWWWVQTKFIFTAIWWWVQNKFIYTVQFGDKYKPSSSLLCNFVISANQVHLHCAIWWWVQINVNKKDQLDASVCRHLFAATSNSTCFGRHSAHSQEFQKLYLLPLV